MQDTEKYLNRILEKRLGSIINYTTVSKNGSAVSRLPKKQERLQNMPTVFRKKEQTVYRQRESEWKMPSQSIQSEVMKQPRNDKAIEKQRVEYLLISKRIEKKKEEHEHHHNQSFKNKQIQLGQSPRIPLPEKTRKKTSMSHQKNYQQQPKLIVEQYNINEPISHAQDHKNYRDQLLINNNENGLATKSKKSKRIFHS